MPAYVIADIEITEPATFEEYRRQVPATIEKFGGRYVVRGGRHETLEGDWTPNRLVVLEFPTLEQARRWYASNDYREPKALRQRCSRGSVVLVEGV